MKTVVFTTLALALPTMAAAEGLSFKSNVEGYQGAALQQLPKAPQGREQDCPRPAAQTPAGKAVEKAGWQVIYERPFAGYDLVSFAAESTIGPQGVCDVADSNLGVFSGGALRGLFWGDQATGDLFGDMEAQGETLLTLTASSFPIVPIAQLAFEDQTFVLRELPATFSGCQGEVEVPHLWKAPIGTMRESLIALGWSPLTFPPAEIVSQSLHAYGFTEAESCAGTGQNYCSFEYETAQAKLRIITIGEIGESYQPIVVDYELTCQAQSGG